MTLTAKRLRTLLAYDPETGGFRRLVIRPGYGLDSKVGSLDNRGYIVIRVDGKLYQAHRLAWFYMKGRWPRDRLDHIDRNPLNNSWVNLRAATHSQNLANSGPRKTNTTGFKGVSFNRRRGKWIAEISVNGKRFYLGYYTTAEDAGAAYQAMAIKHFGDYVNASLLSRRQPKG